MEATPRQRVVRSLPIANSSFYTFYTFYTKNITTLHFEDYRLQTTDNGLRRLLRNHGVTDLRNYGSYAKTTSRAEPANS